MPGERVAADLVRGRAVEAARTRSRLCALDRNLHAALVRHPDASLIHCGSTRRATHTSSRSWATCSVCSLCDRYVGEDALARRAIAAVGEDKDWVPSENGYVVATYIAAMVLNPLTWRGRRSMSHFSVAAGGLHTVFDVLLEDDG